jgi:hypothetical protein
MTDRVAVRAVTQWLSGNGWTVVTSELGYLAKSYPDLSEEQRAEVGDFYRRWTIMTMCIVCGLR